MTRSDLALARPDFIRGRDRGRNRNLERMRQRIESLRLIQCPFGFVFWYLERRISRIADEIERVQS
jgi:hypothetical protein